MDLITLSDIEKYEIEQTFTKIKDVSTSKPEEIFLSGLNFINIRKGGFYICAARAGHGKTTLLLNVMERFAKMKDDTPEQKPKYNCLFFSLEMSKEDCAIRLNHIDKNGQKTVENIEIDDNPYQSIEKIKTKIQNYEIKTGKNIDVIFIDYITKLEGIPQINSKELCLYAKASNKIIGCAAQLNRQFNFNKFTDATSYLAGSSEIERDCTGMITMGKSDPTHIYIDVSKNRFGRTLEEPEKFSGDNFRITGNLELDSEAISDQDILIYDICQIITQWGLTRKLDYDYKFREKTNFHTQNEKELLTVLISGLIGNIILQKKACKTRTRGDEKDIEDTKELLYAQKSGKLVSDLSPKEEGAYTKGYEKMRNDLSTLISRYITRNKEVILKLAKEVNEMLPTKENGQTINKIVELNDKERIERDYLSKVSMLYSPTNIIQDDKE